MLGKVPCLEIDLASHAVRCGRHRVALKPALLAWLAWWATQARAGTPMKSWREADAGEYLALYSRIVGIDAESYEKAQRRLRDGMEEEFFQQNNSKLDAAFRKALGPAAQRHQDRPLARQDCRATHFTRRHFAIV